LEPAKRRKWGRGRTTPLPPPHPLQTVVEVYVPMVLGEVFQSTDYMWKGLRDPPRFDDEVRTVNVNVGVGVGGGGGNNNNEDLDGYGDFVDAHGQHFDNSNNNNSTPNSNNNSNNNNIPLTPVAEKHPSIPHSHKFNQQRFDNFETYPRSASTALAVRVGMLSSESPFATAHQQPGSSAHSHPSTPSSSKQSAGKKVEILPPLRDTRVSGISRGMVLSVVRCGCISEIAEWEWKVYECVKEGAKRMAQVNNTDQTSPNPKSNSSWTKQESIEYFKKLAQPVPLVKNLISQSLLTSSGVILSGFKSDQPLIYSRIGANNNSSNSSYNNGQFNEEDEEEDADFIELLINKDEEESLEEERRREKEKQEEKEFENSELNLSGIGRITPSRSISSNEVVKNIVTQHRGGGGGSAAHLEAKKLNNENYYSYLDLGPFALSRFGAGEGEVSKIFALIVSQKNKYFLTCGQI